MNSKKLFALLLGSGMLLFASGCFRVGSETRVLRDAALESLDAEEKVEVGVGFCTLNLARLGTRFVDLPPEAKLVLDSVGGAECAVYQVRAWKGNSAEILDRADKAMEKRGYERAVGVLHRDQLVAVYLPVSADSPRGLKISVLVIDKHQLVCVNATGDLEPILQTALKKWEEHAPEYLRREVSL